MNNLVNSLKSIASSVMFAAEAVEVEQVLERIAHISRELVNARYAALGVPDGVGGLRYFKVSGMSKEAIALVDHLPKGHGLIGAIMDERKTLRVKHMRDDPRSVGFCAHHPHMNSLLGVPIQVGQQLFGVLYLCDKHDDSDFTDEDAWLIETLAGYAALAISSTQLREQHIRLRMLEDRQRIGMELHDGVIQSLYAIGMHLDLLRLNTRIESDDLHLAIHGLNDVIDDIRRYILNLGRSTERQPTIREAIMSMLARLHAPEKLNVEVKAPNEVAPFSPAMFEGICLIVNEAISNAVRHAEASNLTIEVIVSDAEFIATIEDDGKGFDIQTIDQNTGLGLPNIRQRARFYAGRVKIDSSPGQGTTFSIIIPIKPN